MSNVMKQYLMRWADSVGNSIASVTIMAPGRIRSVQFGVIPLQGGTVVNGFYEVQVGIQPQFEDVPAAQGQSNVAARIVVGAQFNQGATLSQAAISPGQALVPADLGVVFGQVLYVNTTADNNNLSLAGFVIVNVE